MSKILIEIDSPEPPADVVGWLNSQGRGTARWVAAEDVREVNPRPPVLLPYQRAWVDDRSDLKVWDCDRRLGATTAAVEEAIAVASDPDGGPAMIVSSDWQSILYDLNTRGYRTKGFTPQGFSVTDGPGCWPVVVVMESKARDALRGAPWFEAARYIDEAKLTVDSRRPALLVIDNSVDVIRALSWSPSPVVERIAKRLAIVGTGMRVTLGPALYDLLQDAVGAGASIHKTTTRAALAQGYGRKVCEINGETWSPEWEAAFIETTLTVEFEHAEVELRLTPEQTSPLVPEP